MPSSKNDWNQGWIGKEWRPRKTLNLHFLEVSTVMRKKKSLTSLVLSGVKGSIRLHPLSDFFCSQPSRFFRPFLHLPATLPHMLHLLCHPLLHVLHLLSDLVFNVQASLLDWFHSFSDTLSQQILLDLKIIEIEWGTTLYKRTWNSANLTVPSSLRLVCCRWNFSRTWLNPSVAFTQFFLNRSMPKFLMADRKP